MSDPYTCLDQDSETIVSKRVGKQKSPDFFGLTGRMIGQVVDLSTK